MTRADLMRSALSVPGLTPTERVVLGHLAYWHKDDKRGAFRPRDRLAAEVGADPKTVQRCIARLVDLGYLSVLKPARTGTALTVALHPETWPEPRHPPKRSRPTPDDLGQRAPPPVEWGTPQGSSEAPPPWIEHPTP